MADVKYMRPLWMILAIPVPIVSLFLADAVVKALRDRQRRNRRQKKRESNSGRFLSNG